MKQGSNVHKVLEEQVHTEVPVDVVSKEDRFALRIWNVVQGLRTLRRTGMTREMEVWGVVQGEVVNGIIDQVTTTCPDEEAEAEMLKQTDGGSTGSALEKAKDAKPLPPGQMTLSDFYAGSTYGSIMSQDSRSSIGALHQKPKTLYVVDVKTRQSNTLPPQGTQTKPTHYQLMMYYKLLSELAANMVDAEKVFTRYGLAARATFSDRFIAQMSTLGVEAEDDQPNISPWVNEDTEPHPPQQDSLDILLTHNNLITLWSYMIFEFSRTIKTSLSQPTSTLPSLSLLLTAEFRTQSSGSLLGRRHFTFSSEKVNDYANDELRWWRGERETRGVDIEDAFKCRICDFAEGCTWRATKIEDAVKKSRMRKEKVIKSSV
jgi:exonuclease V